MAPIFNVYHASAGCGKTTRLMQIIVDALNSGVLPEQIAFVTFTRAGANVAKSRVVSATGMDAKMFPHFRTIHSLAFRALGASRSDMMDREKYLKLGSFLGMSLDQHGFVDGVNWHELQERQLVSIESLYRNNPAFFERMTENTFDNAALVRYMVNYNKFKNEYKYLDYTDLLEQYIEGGYYEPDIRVACLDEMQDSTPLQWRMVLQAFKYAEQIHIVGDDKQCIYGFNGADANILINFKGNLHVMDTTYRVPSTINDFVQKRIVDSMGERYPLISKSKCAGGEVEYISKFNELTINPNETYYFLARTNTQLKVFKDYLDNACINYSTKDGAVLTPDDYATYQRKALKGEKLDFAQGCAANGWKGELPNIYVSTIHGVKGGEADNVVLLSDIPPLVDREMRSEWGEDNEHRVFYVACTRAKKRLYIMEPFTSRFYGFIL